MLYQTPNPHGGDLYGRTIKLDFSVNTNPLGTPPAVVRAVEKTAGSLCQYPDPFCRELIAALSVREGVPEEAVLCGCGAAELIYTCCAALNIKSALLAAPTFSEYAAALDAVGIEAVHYPLQEAENFAVTADFLARAEKTECKAIFLCNPNNPTGRLISPALWEPLLEICRRRDIRLLVDECFLELSDAGGEASLARFLRSYPKLFLLRAFTKSYGMAGLRLGYCLSGDEALLSAMSRRMQPWNVSLPAQAAGAAALGEDHFLEEARELIRTERPRMARKLEELGFRVCPSQANYLLLKSGRELYGPLLARGILIRDCSNYRGLGFGWYRAAVKTPAENDQLISALADILTT